MTSKDIGVWWVRNYHGHGSNLTNTKAQAEGFTNTLHGTSYYNYGDDQAWDADLEGDKGDYPEIVFFSGHGSNSPQLYFGVRNHNNGLAQPAAMRLGDDYLNWLVFDACQTLEKGPHRAWRQVFNGLHYILGFHTTSSDEPYRGKYFAQYLNAGWTVREAWKKACQQTEDASTTWAYYRADGNQTATKTDHWIGKGYVSADPTNPTGFWRGSGPC